MRQSAAASLIAALALAGCAAPAKPPPVTIAPGPRATTFAIDARDYNEVAAALSSSILADPRLAAGGKKTLALGPIDFTHCEVLFDDRRLQEKIQTILLQSGHFDVSFAVNALRKQSEQVARLDVMYLQWLKESTVDPEELKTFGGLAKVDYLLFGRIATQASVRGADGEMTYTYNWKIGDCESGLLAWAGEKELTKSGSATEIEAALKGTDGPPAVEVWTDRGNGTYRAGEALRVYLRARRDCHARVYFVSADGTALEIYPANLWEAGKIERGVIVEIGGPGWPETLTMSDSGGADEHIRVFANSRPLFPWDTSSAFVPALSFGIWDKGYEQVAARMRGRRPGAGLNPVAETAVRVK